MPQDRKASNNNLQIVVGVLAVLLYIEKGKAPADKLRDRSGGTHRRRLVNICTAALHTIST